MSRSAGRMIVRLRRMGRWDGGTGRDAGCRIAVVSACADFSLLRCLSSVIMPLWGFDPDDVLSGCSYAEKRGRHHRLLLRPSGHVALPNPFRRATQKPTLVYVIDAIAVCLHEQISIGHYITQRTSIVAIVSEWISEIATFRTI